MAKRFFRKIGNKVSSGTNKLGNLIKDEAPKIGNIVKRGYTSDEALDISKKINTGLNVGAGVLAPALIASGPMTGGTSALAGAGLLGLTAASNANLAGMQAARGNNKGAMSSGLEAGKKTGATIGTGQKGYTQYQKSQA